MQILELTTKNFGKLGSVHLDLSGGKVHLFCGPNESGKSTLSEAVRFALLGDSPRVPLKKDHDLLISDGHTKGRVTMKYLAARGGQALSMHRDVHSTGTVSKNFQLDSLATQCLGIALQATTFASADEKARRKLLTDLLDIEISREKIGERLMKEYEIGETIVKTIMPALRGGFEAALIVAKGEVSKARASWEAATGERFGTDKAKEWKPKEPPADVTDEELKAADEALSAADGALENAAKLIGEAKGGIQARETLVSERDRLVALKTEEPKWKMVRTKANLAIMGLNAEIKDLNDQLTWANQAKEVLVCPNCDAKVNLKNGVLQPLSITEIETVVDRGTGVPVNELPKAIAKAEADLKTAQQSLATAAANLESIKNADTRISEIDKVLNQLGDAESPSDTAENMAELEATRGDARKAQEEARLARDKLRDQRQTFQQFGQKVKQAKSASESYYAWEKCAKALEPEGLPAVLLNEAIQPINKRLEASSALVKWPRVQLNTDVELIRDTETEKRRFSLISESAQWRGCAIMADAISSLSGLKVLILDRADVLDMQGRKELFAWLHFLAEDEYDTILVFATLKEKPPAGAVGDATVHWIPDIVKNQSQPAEK